jgi:hypothetical protein
VEMSDDGITFLIFFALGWLITTWAFVGRS